MENENPYQTPESIPPEPEKESSKHTSFRLTTEESDSTELTIKDAIVFALVLQIPILLITGLVMDGGHTALPFQIAAVVFWGLVGSIFVIKQSKLSAEEKLLIKWGYLLLLFVVMVVSRILMML